MKKSLRTKKILVAVVLAGLVSVVSFGIIKNVYAMSDLEAKVAAAELVNCYNDGKFKKSLTTTDLQSRRADASSFVKGSACTDTVNNIANDRNISLPDSSTSAADIDTFLTSIGYTSEGSTSTGECISLTYDITGVGSESVSTQKLCATDLKVVVDEDGTEHRYINSDKLKIIGGNDNYVEFQNNKKGSVSIDCSVGKVGTGGCTKHKFKKGETDWDEFAAEIKNDILASNAKQVTYKKGTTKYTATLRGLNDGEVPIARDNYGNYTKKYTLKVDAESLKKGTLTLAGTEYSSAPIFTADEQFAIYQGYLREYYGADIQCNWTDDQIAAHSKEYKEVKYFNEGEFKTCYAKASKNANKKVTGFDKDGKYGKKLSFNDIVGAMSSSTATSFPESAYSYNVNPGDSNNPNKPSGDPTSINSQSELLADGIVDCNELENIGAMQWVLCPGMNNLQYTTSWIDNMTQDWLELKTDLYTDDSHGDGKGVYDVWANIRNVANVLMIIFLLIIVFSQLTGYGIDNYGIKKMLPRLIVMAIIVNLSFYVCQLAVDVSNIAGAGLRDMFGAFGANLTDVADKPSFLGGAITGLFTAAANGSAAIGAAFTAFSLGAPVAVAVVIMVIVLLLIIIIAVLILFLMLGARDIIVVLCLVLSPLAFAAYILPNTQYLFKKWWELFKAALIIFPICGAMAGISYMLRGTFSKGTHPWYVIAVAMVLPYLGFFLIPMLLKNAIAALGKIGGALTAMGSNIRNGGRAMIQSGAKVAQNTEGFKNMQANALRRRQSDSSKRTINRLEDLKKQREREGKELTDDETLRLARAHETQKKLANENMAARTILAENKYANTRLGNSNDVWDDGDEQTHTLMARWNKARVEGDADELTALTNVITSRHGPGGVNTMAKAMNNWDVFGNDGKFVDDKAARAFNALSGNLTQNSAFANAMQNKASDAYQMLSSGGYGGDNIRHNLDYHSEHNDIATQDKDWATQSKATLERAIEKGALSGETAQRILNSTDPTIMSGIQSDAGKREVLQAAADKYEFMKNASANGYQGDFNEGDSIQLRGGMNAGYVGRNASSVQDEAMIENQQRAGGMNPNYVNKTSRDVEEEAWAENKRRDESIRRTDEQRRSDARDADLHEIAVNLRDLNNKGSGDNNGGQGFSDGGGI